MMSVESDVLLVFLGIISFFYSIPFITINGQKFGIRNIPGLKQFLIVFVWTVSCVFIPILEAQHLQLKSISVKETLVFVAARFLFFGALTVPFDIRDLFEDKLTGVKTIPVIWGEKNAYLVCQILLACYILLLVIFSESQFNSNFWALSFTAILTGWLLFKAKWEKNEYYYFFFVDGVLIVQYAALIVFDKVGGFL